MFLEAACIPQSFCAGPLQRGWALLPQLSGFSQRKFSTTGSDQIGPTAIIPDDVPVLISETLIASGKVPSAVECSIFTGSWNEGMDILGEFCLPLARAAPKAVFLM